MVSVKRLADEVARGLGAVHPRKTVLSQLALAVGAMIEGHSPNTMEWANRLPLDTERQDLREPWRRRLLKNARLDPAVVSAPVARAELVKARHGQTVWWRLDQTAVGDRMALRMVARGPSRRGSPTSKAGASTWRIRHSRMPSASCSSWPGPCTGVSALAETTR